MLRGFDLHPACLDRRDATVKGHDHRRKREKEELPPQEGQQQPTRGTGNNHHHGSHYNRERKRQNHDHGGSRVKASPKETEHKNGRNRTQKQNKKHEPYTIFVGSTWRNRYLGGHYLQRGVDSSGWALIWCRTCAGYSTELLGARVRKLCNPKEKSRDAQLRYLE